MNVGEYRAWLAKHARPAWKPVCASRASTNGAQFGGAPLLLHGETWPRCGQCHEPMPLFVQLRLASLPQRIPGEGWLQVFLCTGDCDTYEPFSAAHLVRLIDGAAVVATPPDGFTQFPPQAITGWTEHADVPHWEELEGLGLDSRQTPDVDDAPSEGAKLGGWPLWIQGAEYPNCPRCGRRMTYRFQIDSEDHIPHMFGDAGNGHITQCDEHPSVLAFAWACF